MPHREKHSSQLFREPALLIVEVLSPANTVDDIERKRIRYLRHGVQELWIVYETTRTMHVHQRQEEVDEHRPYRTFVAEEGDRFESSLGFPVELSRIFG